MYLANMAKVNVALQEGKGRCGGKESVNNSAKRLLLTTRVMQNWPGLESNVTAQAKKVSQHGDL